MFKQIKKKTLVVSEGGFTLVELMVVVAIIGILAAVAIPNYQKYQSRARQSEAKIQLASAYTAEQSFYAEAGTYSSALAQIGFATPAGTRTYYTVGFDSAASPAGNATCGPAGGKSCIAYRYDNTGNVVASGAAADTFVPATAGIGGLTTIASFPSIVATNLTQNHFLVQGAGKVSTSTTVDNWSIDETKALNNVSSGI